MKSQKSLRKKLTALALVLAMVVSVFSNIGVIVGHALDVESPAAPREDVSSAAGNLTLPSGAVPGSAPSGIIYWNPQDTEFFVDGQVYIQGGDDANDGSSSSCPVRTFERAKDLVSPGGEIRIMKVCPVEANQVIDGGSKNITLARWEGSDIAESYSGVYFAVHNGAALTVRNITFGHSADDKNDRQIQLAGKTTILNIEENTNINGFLFLETPGAKITINEDPPQEKYKLQFEDNAKFDGQTIVENANGADLSGRISEYFELKVNICGDNIYKYHWVMIPNASVAKIDVDRRDLYPGVYLNGMEAGDDANDGISPERPVKTFAKAKELAKTLYGGKCIIYICGQVTVSKLESWELPKSEYPDCTVQRFDNSTGAYDGGAYKNTLPLRSRFPTRVSTVKGAMLTLPEE